MSIRTALHWLFATPDVKTHPHYTLYSPHRGLLHVVRQWGELSGEVGIIDVINFTG